MKSSQKPLSYFRPFRRYTYNHNISFLHAERRIAYEKLNKNIEEHPEDKEYLCKKYRSDVRLIDEKIKDLKEMTISHEKKTIKTKKRGNKTV